MPLHKFYRVVIALFCCSICTTVRASHLEGGEMTYKYLGDTTISGSLFQKYQLTVVLYSNCLNAQPEAVAQDNPLFITIYAGGSPVPYLADSTLRYSGISTAPATHLGPCGPDSSSLQPESCLLMRIFTKNYYLAANATGYTIVNQRCCRNASLVNVVGSGDGGVTYFCSIPPATTPNSSAVFQNYATPAICINQTAIFDLDATDADGDSLSYELAPAYTGASDADIKPFVSSPPPYDTVKYAAPYSFTSPIASAAPLQIDALTGKITVTANLAGRYLIVVACKEWRHGVLINTMRREFYWAAIDCSAIPNKHKPDAGSDYKVVAGDEIHFNATGAASFSWSPATFLNNPGIPDPVGHFTDAGTYQYVVNTVSDSGCAGSDTLLVTVLAHSEFAVPNAFTPNGDGINDYLEPRPVSNCTLKSFEIFNRLGNKVYSSGDGGASWDGDHNSKHQAPGVYVWQLVYTDNTGSERTMSGNVTLLR